MKKALAVLAVVLVAGAVLAQDIVSGTFGKLDGNEVHAQKVKVPVSGLVINGTAVSATAATLNAAAGKSATGVTNVTAQVGTTVTATGTVAIVATWVALTNVFDSVTNVFYAPTAVPTATTAINVLNGAGFVTNVLNQR